MTGSPEHLVVEHADCFMVRARRHPERVLPPLEQIRHVPLADTSTLGDFRFGIPALRAETSR